MKIMKLTVNNRSLYLDKTQVMGILNVTPDSFFDGGKYNTIAKAVDHVYQMITHGATLIDIGGESTRPGSIQISDEEELERVEPIIHAVVERFNVLVSINTSSALVISESAKMGAHLINDVRSLNSKDSMKAAKSSNLAICLTHMQGNPTTMQDSPTYCNVVSEIDNYFHKQIDRCQSAGIDRNRLLIDPGFGFGKKVIHNYQLLSNLSCFHHFKLPLLIGVSRKSMVNYNYYFNNAKPEQKLIGSVACAVIAAIQGVHIIRVHDVKETMEALNIVHTMKAFNKNR